ncbi:MAG: hypothetical protein EOP88_21800 [Verrucomicrobiaceae bacterium]|nr:MAG: hypothetical protein EOP88_21800 [Verrucomicrobiaceae bacterium]
MIAPIIHLREGTLELIEEMIGQVDLYLNAHASRIARILTKDTGWGGLGEGSVRVTRTSLGAPCISCGRPHDNLSLVLDEGLLTWNPRTERPTLEGIRELLVTIAVRGTPAFGSGPAPTATADGFRYTVRGSLTLAGFTSPVSVVTTPVAPPAPNATPPAGYVWRTFSLDGSNNLPGKGFLRVAVEEAP